MVAQSPRSGSAIGLAFLAMMLCGSVTFDTSHSQGEDLTSLPSVTRVCQLVRQWMKEEALAKDESTKLSAMRNLCDAYAAMRLHPKFGTSEMLQRESHKVRHRLIASSSKLSRKLEREGVPRPMMLDDESTTYPKLNSWNSHENDQHAAPTDADGVGASAGAMGMEAWQLIELIQSTVHPDFWEPAGGTGSIRYFAARRVLVVRATTEVHEDLRRLLRQL